MKLRVRECVPLVMALLAALSLDVPRRAELGVPIGAATLRAAAVDAPHLHGPLQAAPDAPSPTYAATGARRVQLEVWLGSLWVTRQGAGALQHGHRSVFAGKSARLRDARRLLRRFKQHAHAADGPFSG